MLGIYCEASLVAEGKTGFYAGLYVGFGAKCLRWIDFASNVTPDVTPNFMADSTPDCNYAKLSAKFEFALQVNVDLMNHIFTLN